MARSKWTGSAGSPVRQKTIRVHCDDDGLEFDSVSIREANRTQDIVTQAYSLQNESIRMDARTYDDGQEYEGYKDMEIFARENTIAMEAIRATTPEQYARDRQELKKKRKKQ